MGRLPCDFPPLVLRLSRSLQFLEQLGSLCLLLNKPFSRLGRQLLGDLRLLFGCHSHCVGGTGHVLDSCLHLFSGLSFPAFLLDFDALLHCLLPRSILLHGYMLRFLSDGAHFKCEPCGCLFLQFDCPIGMRLHDCTDVTFGFATSVPGLNDCCSRVLFIRLRSQGQAIRCHFRLLDLCEFIIDAPMCLHLL